MGSLMALSYSAFAVNITVTQSCGSVPLVICNQLTTEVESFINADLPEVSIGDYGTGIANSQGFAYRGLSSDYSDAFDYFMLRAGAGFAVEGDLDAPENASGVGVGAAATVGLNLDLLPIDKVGPIELEKLDLFITFMNYSPDQDLEDTQFKGDISAFGFMARYQIVDAIDIVPGNLFKWGGVFIHTGIQRSSVEADVTQSFPNEEITTDSGQTATLNNTSANFTFETSNTTIPIEVSTYLRMAWALTLFTGAGFDLVSGSTDVSLNASGTATGNGATSGYSAVITADESASGDADSTNFRAFLGGQLNLPFFRLYAQFNKGLGNDNLGLHFGAKVLW